MKKRRLEQAPSTARWFALLMVVGLTGLLASCYPGELNNIEELDVVATTHKQSTDFTQFNSWALNDTINAIDARDPDNPEDLDLTPEQEQAIKDTITENMIALGYGQPLTDPNGPTPDVYVVAGVVVSQGYIWFSFSPWYPWNPWCPGCGCCWGGGWWGGGGGTTFDIGTLLIDMQDITDIGANPPSEDNPLIPVWSAGVNGILQGSSSSTNRLENLIDQAYIQSPYLATGNGGSPKK